MQRLHALISALALTATVEPRPTKVTVDAPIECTTATAFEAELLARTHVVQPVTDTAAATAWVELSITKKKKTYAARLLIRTTDGVLARRSIDGRDCVALARAMTLTAALSLDPEAKLGPVVVPVAPPEPPPTPEPPPPEPPPPPPEPTPAPPPPPVVVISTPAPAPKKELEVGVHVGAEALTSAGVSGLFDFGGGGRVSLLLRPPNTPLFFEANVGAGALSGRTVTAPAGRVRYGARFLGDLQANLGVTWRWLRLSGGGFVQLAPIFVEGLDGDTVTNAQRLLFAVGPVLSALADAQRWFFGVRVWAGISLRRDTYAIDPTGVVFTVPDVALTAALTAGFRFR